MRRQVLVAGLALMMFGGLCVLEDHVSMSKPQEPQGRGTLSVYMLAGEFRTVFANLMWIKADQYHHEYLEHHSDWTKDTELVGLMEMITALDPHFVEAYSVGGALYCHGARDSHKALAFLREGIANNPKAWPLYQDAAIICALHLHNPTSARHYARLALKYCDDGFYTGSLRRLAHTIERMDQAGSGSPKAK